MKLKNKLAGYLEYCKFRKELDEKTLKAYRIDLKQYFNFVSCDEPDKEKIEEYILSKCNPGWPDGRRYGDKL